MTKREQLSTSGVTPAAEQASTSSQAAASTGSYPGDPVDTSLLVSYGSHVAAAIWQQKERGELKVINHDSKIGTWLLDQSRSRILSTIARSRLDPLLQCSYVTCNKTIFTAFTERWHPKTNTFHMPFREMTITLDDVSSLLGIPVVGRTISFDTVSIDEANRMLVRLLGVSEEKAKEETIATRGLQVKMQCLRDMFEMVSDFDSEE